MWRTVSSQPEGLSQQDALHRLQSFGPNRLRPEQRKGPLQRFFAQFHNVLIYVLLGAGGITALLGHWVDSGVILGVVLINAGIGYIQEGKAEKALDAIRNMLSHTAMVRRDGRFISLPADELVPGDVVMLQSGDKVPADLRLYKLRELRIDEAILTGESIPVDKDTRPTAGHAAIGDRTCLAYSGTLVSYGQGQGVVVGGPGPLPSVSIQANGDGTVTISWTGGGVLQSAPAVTGDWSDVADATSPHTVSVDGTAFYRVAR